LVKIISKANLLENVRTVVENSRTHSIVCDLPPSKGGDDKGPTAIELAIMALSDCAATIFAKVAKQSNVDIQRVEVVAEATKSEDNPLISDVVLKVDVAGRARKQLLEAIWRRTEANCPVVKLFTEPINIKIELSTETVE